MDELFSDVAARLAAHPKIGTTGKIPGTRELIPHENYRLVYQIDAGTVWMLAPSTYRPPVATGEVRTLTLNLDIAIGEDTIQCC